MITGPATPTIPGFQNINQYHRYNSQERFLLITCRFGFTIIWTELVKEISTYTTKERGFKMAAILKKRRVLFQYHFDDGKLNCPEVEGVNNLQTCHVIAPIQLSSP